MGKIIKEVTNIVLKKGKELCVISNSRTFSEYYFYSKVLSLSLIEGKMHVYT